jgi:6-phosphofructokinase 1
MEAWVATFGILVGGGPAPGINGVIGAATVAAERAGARVIGMLEGFRWLMEGDTSHVRELCARDVATLHLQGGSILKTSRANPTKKPGDLETVVKSLEALAVDHLITIGGDDTAFSSHRVAEAAGGRIKVVHVPKTIDNDLPLPEGTPTFGFETARACGAQVLTRLLEDARTTQRWYIAVVMGRHAGHLALGTGKAAGATVSVIAEDFPEGSIRLDSVTRIIEGSILKRMAAGESYGIAVLAEGLGERFDERDLEGLGDVERDDHGHIRLAEMPVGKIVRDAVRDSLAQRGVKVTMVVKDVGYELRCAEPVALDIDYTQDLGVGAVRTLLAGQSQKLITRQQGRIVPLSLDDLMDPATGRTRVRMVDTSTESHAIAHALQVRIEAADLEDEGRAAPIAEAGGLSVEELRERFGSIV